MRNFPDSCKPQTRPLEKRRLHFFGYGRHFLHKVASRLESLRFMSVTDGVSWENVSAPLGAISFVWMGLFLFYASLPDLAYVFQFPPLSLSASFLKPSRLFAGVIIMAQVSFTYFAVLNVLTAVFCRSEAARHGIMLLPSESNSAEVRVPLRALRTIMPLPCSP